VQSHQAQGYYQDHLRESEAQTETGLRKEPFAGLYGRELLFDTLLNLETVCSDCMRAVTEPQRKDRSLPVGLI
jgi:thymidine kinase